MCLALSDRPLPLLSGQVVDIADARLMSSPSLLAGNLPILPKSKLNNWDSTKRDVKDTPRKSKLYILSKGIFDLFQEHKIIRRQFVKYRRTTQDKAFSRVLIILGGFCSIIFKCGNSRLWKETNAWIKETNAWQSGAGKNSLSDPHLQIIWKHPHPISHSAICQWWESIWLTKQNGWILNHVKYMGRGWTVWQNDAPRARSVSELLPFFSETWEQIKWSQKPVVLARLLEGLWEGRVEL